MGVLYDAYHLSASSTEATGEAGFLTSHKKSLLFLRVVTVMAEYASIS